MTDGLAMKGRVLLPFSVGLMGKAAASLVEVVVTKLCRKVLEEVVMEEGNADAEVAELSSERLHAESGDSMEEGREVEGEEASTECGDVDKDEELPAPEEEENELAEALKLGRASAKPVELAVPLLDEEAFERLMGSDFDTLNVGMVVVVILEALEALVLLIPEAVLEPLWLDVPLDIEVAVLLAPLCGVTVVVVVVLAVPPDAAGGATLFSCRCWTIFLTFLMTRLSEVLPFL